MHTAEPQVPRWHAVADAQAVQQRALAMILARAAQAICERGQFHLVLAGGDTPREIYRQLRSAQTPWRAWHVYFGDERCLPADAAERNSRMVADAWLDHVAIPASQIHPIPAELGAARACAAYAQVLRAVGEFDLVLLGLGEDGHTASLFPGREWGAVPGSTDALAVFDAPKPPPERVSLSAARLARTRAALFLVSGAAKHRAVLAWLAGGKIPAASIRPAAGVDVLVEAALLGPIVEPVGNGQHPSRMK